MQIEFRARPVETVEGHMATVADFSQFLRALVVRTG